MKNKTRCTPDRIHITTRIQQRSLMVILLVGMIIGSIFQLGFLKLAYAITQLPHSVQASPRLLNRTNTTLSMQIESNRTLQGSKDELHSAIPKSFQVDNNNPPTPQPATITILEPSTNVITRTLADGLPPAIDTPLYSLFPITSEIAISITWPDGQEHRVKEVEYTIGDRTIVANSAPFDRILFPIDTLAQGNYKLNVRVTDEYGNIIEQKKPLTIYIDRQTSSANLLLYTALALTTIALIFAGYVWWNPRFKRHVTENALSIGTNLYSHNSKGKNIPKARLKRVDGPNTTPDSIELHEGIMKIGRSSTVATIPINDANISRLHCRIEERNNTFWIYDEASANGTKIDGARVSTKGQMLQPGNVIGIGSVKYRFEPLDNPNSNFDEESVTGIDKSNVDLRESYLNSALDKAAEDNTAIYRYPDVSMPSQVTVNQVCVLRIAITEKPIREEIAQIAMALTPMSEDYETEAVKDIRVDVLISAQDFELMGPSHYTLEVPVSGDSTPFIVRLKPISIGKKEIKVEFFQNSRYVGGISLSICVNNKDVPETAVTEFAKTNGNIQLNSQTVAPDLQILITERQSADNHLRYTFKLHAPTCGLYFHTIHEELSFSGSPSKWISSLYKELIKLPAESGAEDVRDTLNTIGADLYEKLFPQELKELWVKLIRKQVKSIMIISDEPWIPWEMIRPAYEDESGEIKEDGFLCEDYWLTRWLAGPTPPSQITIKQGALISPSSSGLPSAQLESNFLTGLGIVTTVEPNLTAVRKLLSIGGYELLHFACHGSFDPESNEQSIIYLQGRDTLKTRDISGERRNFRKDTPLVFVNACCTSRADFSLVGISSWADKFIHENASGFVGSAWEVNDKLAYIFSKTFYENLLAGKTIGAALQAARLAIKDEPDSTWLAYTIYADPLATVKFVKE